MSLAPETLTRIEAVEARLALLDPILKEFAARHGYTFKSMVGTYPRRRLWRRDDVDRCLDLMTDLSVKEVGERGFTQDMPWSLHASASLVPDGAVMPRVLRAEIFRGMPYARLAFALKEHLESGVKTLQGFTREEIAAKGQA